MNEIWKDIKGYEGLYQVSNLGRVKSLKRYFQANQYIKKEFIKTLSKDRDGYLHVSLYYKKKRKPKRFRVHRLVLQTFIGFSKLEVNHKDGNKLNNNLNNLEYCTRLQNEQHAWKNGLKRRDNGNITPVIQYDLNGRELSRFISQAEAYRNTGIKSGLISACICGEQHTAGGYVWRKLK